MIKPIQNVDPDSIKAFESTAQRIMAGIVDGIGSVKNAKRELGKLTPDDNDHRDTKHHFMTTPTHVLRLANVLKEALRDPNPDTRGDRAAAIINMAFASGYQEGCVHDINGFPEIQPPEPWEPLESVRKLAKY